MAALQMAACWTGSTTQTAGVLPDGNGIDDVVDGRQAAGGVDDAAVGGLPEVSSVDYAMAGCRTGSMAHTMSWQSTMARGCLNKLNQVRQCILRAN